MPRTRQSLATSHLSPRNGKVNREAAALNSPTAKKSPKPMRKKRTVSDRSPVVTKTQRSANMNTNGNDNEEHGEKENVTPAKMGVTPYWKVCTCCNPSVSQSID